MAKRESVQKKLQRNRPPRVQLTYDVEVGDAKDIQELPFVVGVLGDFSAASELEKTKLKDQKFINVDLDNIDEVMTSLAPRAAFQVENMLTEEKGSLTISLTFNAVSYKHIRAHETVLDLVCRLLHEKKKIKKHR